MTDPQLKFKIDSFDPDYMYAEDIACYPQYGCWTLRVTHTGVAPCFYEVNFPYTGAVSKPCSIYINAEKLEAKINSVRDDLSYLTLLKAGLESQVVNPLET